jgi:ATP-dependent DNA ligase
LPEALSLSAAGFHNDDLGMVPAFNMLGRGNRLHGKGFGIMQPRLVCEVAYAEWTDDEQLRQTTFLGWRDDKRPEEIVLEVTSPFM